MSESPGSVLHQQALSVMGFLTGLVLTALVLILNTPKAFQVAIGPLSGDQYFQILSTYVATVGVVSASAMVAFLEVAGGLSKPFSFVDKLGTALFFLSVFGFMGALPLILVAFTVTGAGIVLTLELVLNSLYFLGRRAFGPEAWPGR